MKETSVGLAESGYAGRYPRAVEDLEDDKACRRFLKRSALLTSAEIDHWVVELKIALTAAPEQAQPRSRFHVLKVKRKLENDKLMKKAVASLRATRDLLLKLAEIAAVLHSRKLTPATVFEAWADAASSANFFGLPGELAVPTTPRDLGATIALSERLLAQFTRRDPKTPKKTRGRKKRGETPLVYQQIATWSDDRSIGGSLPELTPKGLAALVCLATGSYPKRADAARGKCRTAEGLLQHARSESRELMAVLAVLESVT